MESDSKIAKVEMISASEFLQSRGLDEMGRVQRYIDSEVIRLMAKYTPKETGTGIDSATKLTTIGSGTIKQGGALAPYMAHWYYTNANFTGAPTRGTRWFERMLNGGGRQSILKGAIRESGAKK